MTVLGNRELNEEEERDLHSLLAITRETATNDLREELNNRPKFDYVDTGVLEDANGNTWIQLNDYGEPINTQYWLEGCKTKHDLQMMQEQNKLLRGGLTAARLDASNARSETRRIKKRFKLW